MTIPDLTEPYTGENAEGWFFEPVEGDGDCEVGPFTEADVAKVLSEYTASMGYEYHNRYWLVLLNDGRFALISDEESGTCSYCGSSVGRVLFSTDYRKMYEFGLTEELRNFMPNVYALLEDY